MSRGMGRRAEQGATSLYLNVPKLCRDSQDVLFHSLHSKITVLSFNTVVVQVADRGKQFLLVAYCIRHVTMLSNTIIVIKNVYDKYKL